ncbi:MAG: CRISPR-associated ring nuclease Csm6 [Bryobacteraceae bacterium]|nr:CRISPR-associated ring nuclease Csm6 [Bryobacteraceae bacterium]MCX7602855.1 CRISPR-associated ring nuclease Csm6 [Bryobacteraceae bacterium]
MTGLSPQVVTETLYALAVQRKPAWIPQELRLVTTAEGAERARLTLLDRKAGWFHRMRREYRLPEMKFDASCIRVVRDAEGRPLADIRTAPDNMAAADFLLREIRSITRDPRAELHVSIAGGRKTMGFFAGYALSLCGRPQDVLSHVLVDPPFESHPGFFYPTRAPHVIHTPPPESRPLDASQARVTLAEIPFVRLRELLERGAGEEDGGFAEAVNAVQREVSPTLSFDCTRGAVRASGMDVRMRPAELAFYAMIARAAKEGHGVPCPSGGEDEPLARAFLAEYERCAGSRDIERTRKALKKGMDREYFLERASRVNKALREALGEARAYAYQIHPAGRRMETEYRLGLDPESIHFANEEKSAGRLIR